MSGSEILSTELQSLLPPGPPRRRGRLIGWLTTASLTAVVVAWLMLVLDDQYQVRWLSQYVIASDGLFLAGLAGIILALSLQRWGIAHVLSTTRRLALSVAVLVLALGAAEFAARSALRGALTNHPSVSLNSLGFREREFEPKAPGRYRIVIVGDSFTFGNGVEAPDRFSNQLQNYLGAHYDVLNMGRPGNNLPEHLSALDLALKLSPDFVLLQLYENDFETPTMAGHRPRDYTLLPADLDRHVEADSVLFRLLVQRWNLFQERTGMAEGYTRYMARRLRDPGAPDAREGTLTLTAFIERARDAGVPNGGVMFPAIYGLTGDGANYPFDYLNDRARKIYDDEQRPFLDLMPVFLTVHDPQSLVVSPWDAHPNAKANHLAAIAILNRFLPVWRH